MADKGIIFSAPMVRALLDGRKTQTRRLLKPRPDWLDEVKHTRYTSGALHLHWPVGSFGQQCGMPAQTPYAPGDRLYVREAWACHWATDNQPPRDIDPYVWTVRYLADDTLRPATKDGSVATPDQCRKGRPSIFMPRWASRLTLLVSDVRVERVASISSADAEAEGVERHDIARGWRNYRQPKCFVGAPETSCETLWDSLHDKPGERWADNPWVVAVTFAVVRENIDRIRKEV